MANEGYMPEPFTLASMEVAGTSRQCGRVLGERWQEMLRQVSVRRRGTPQWWTQPAFRGLVESIAPHLPDLYVGMAEGAGIAPDELVEPVPRDVVSVGGCTSFAIERGQTEEGHLICGQTKDAPASRVQLNVVLKLSLSDGPSALTMTYPGMLFGHGFVAGGCAIFRNSISVHPIESRDPLPYPAWGLLALHCKTVDQVCALTVKHPIAEPFHCTVSDEQGRIVGIEHADGDTAVLRPTNGIYAHANNICCDRTLLGRESCDDEFKSRSRHRGDRLHQALAETGNSRATPDTVRRALSDHDGYPYSVCNHESERFCTSAVLIARPTLRQMTVISGPACCNPPVEYRL